MLYHITVELYGGKTIIEDLEAKDIDEVKSIVFDNLKGDVKYFNIEEVLKGENLCVYYVKN